MLASLFLLASTLSNVRCGLRLPTSLLPLRKEKLKARARPRTRGSKNGAGAMAIIDLTGEDAFDFACAGGDPLLYRRFKSLNLCSSGFISHLMW